MEAETVGSPETGKQLARRSAVGRQRRMTRAAVLCVVLACGCGPAPPRPPENSAAAKAQADAARSRTCFQPLEAHCRNSACPNYADSVEELRRFVGTGRCLAANVGTCGDLRFTRVSDGIAWTIEYFDASGTLVAAREGTDVVTNPECHGWSHFGERLTCSEVATENYCTN